MFLFKTRALCVFLSGFFSSSLSVRAEEAAGAPESVGIYLSTHGITLPGEHRGLLLVFAQQRGHILGLGHECLRGGAERRGEGDLNVSLM